MENSESINRAIKIVLECLADYLIQNAAGMIGIQQKERLIRILKNYQNNKINWEQSVPEIINSLDLGQMVVVFKHTVTNLSEKKLSNRNQLKSHLEKLRDLRNTIAHLGAGKDASPDERKAAMNLSENIITILGCHEKAMILAKLDVENVVNIVYLEEADKKFKAGKYEQAIMYYIKGGSEHSAKKCKARLLAEHDRFEQAIKLYRLIPDLQRSPEDNRLILQYCIACNAIETAIQFMLETSLYSQKDIMKFIEDNDLDPAVLYTYLPGLDPAHQQHIFNHHLMPKFNQLSQNCENIINQMNSIMEIDWNV